MQPKLLRGIRLEVIESRFGERGFHFGRNRRTGARTATDVWESIGGRKDGIGGGDV